MTDHSTSMDHASKYDGGNGQTKGNLAHKSDIGQLKYYANRATSALNIDYPVPPDQPPYIINLQTQIISYTSHHKARTISEVVDAINHEVTYTYGPDQQRRTSTRREHGQLKETRTYVGDYEKQVIDGVTREIHYVSGGDGLCAMLVREGGNTKLYYVFKDHLGSIIKVVEASGFSWTVVAEQNFDAWGRRRKPSTWEHDDVPSGPSWLYRGYTGHEHVEPFRLINMNGRMYDPLNGRMMGVDKYVQGTLGTQGFNRYSYAGNNPLKFTDPTGDFIWFVVAGAIAGGYLGGAIAAGEGGLSGADWNPFGGMNGKWSGDWWKGSITGALIGASVGMGVAAGVGAAGTGFGPGFTAVGVKQSASASFNILSNGLITSNMNIGASVLIDGGWNEAWSSGLIGLGAGMIGGAVGVMKNGVARAVAWQPNPIKLQNVVTSTVNGFGTRLHNSGGQLTDALLGAGEGFYLSYFWANRLVGAGGNEKLLARYLSSATSSFSSSLPGLGLTIANLHYLGWSYGSIGTEGVGGLSSFASGLGMTYSGIFLTEWLRKATDYQMAIWPFRGFLD